VVVIRCKNKAVEVVERRCRDKMATNRHVIMIEESALNQQEQIR
jgi:hypothetical protein